MKKIAVIGLLVVLLFSLSACVADSNTMVNTENAAGVVAGFWQGLWHGFISLFTFIISLFNNNVGVYEVHNNGGWYNFGFILGVSMFFGGSGGGGSKAYSRKKQ